MAPVSARRFTGNRPGRGSSKRLNASRMRSPLSIASLDRFSGSPLWIASLDRLRVRSLVLYRLPRGPPLPSPSLLLSFFFIFFLLPADFSSPCPLKFSFHFALSVYVTLVSRMFLSAGGRDFARVARNSHRCMGMRTSTSFLIKYL
jgi:hypothetical protein